MLIPSSRTYAVLPTPSLSRRVNANSQPGVADRADGYKLIKKGEC